ncbi:MAG: tetratricopeptide repeat protein [Candidatus Omnitrophica bacterium]|nr:tetratricopeptide repeat protein [Candidatus Omnitrophota bacterium]
MFNKKTEDISVQNRVVRVFVSSTFKDMCDEREELVKFVFPELRRRCRQRQVEFVGVDLRWGITDEQKAEGKVLPICLREIEECRPYFIGLLGERYGWVPKTIDNELLELQPWLSKHKEKSVTELEILHGVLEDPKMKGLAYFYLRDKGASEKIEQSLSREPGYLAEPDASRVKLEVLKARIKASGYPLRTDYLDTKAFGKLVLEDLWSAIDSRFPLENVPTELQRIQAEHEAFASLRTKVYIKRKEYFDSLDNHIASSGPPLVLLGESGSGKSALLANWAEEYKKSHSKDFIICHYIGSTPDSADYVRLLWRIMDEIKERYEPGVKEKKAGIFRIRGLFSGGQEEWEIPTDPQKVVEAFPIWLARAAARGKFILLLDGLNQLEDRDNASDLGWLPYSFPVNVRLIVSTLPGRSSDALKKRNWPELNIQPMEKNEQKKYIIDYLQQYRKALTPAQIDKITQKKQSSNPLYLRTLLEELRVFGLHEDLDRKIDYYLQAETVDGLFNLVLERLEEDYEKERKGLVREVMMLIWASHKGLSETELLEFLGSEDAPLPRVNWSALYLALEEYLVSRAGLLSFFHDFLKKAVETRYLSSSELKREAHLIIADYFDKRNMDYRKVDELPWQLLRAESWQRLEGCVTDMDMFMKLMVETKLYELIGYWLSIGIRYDMVEAYQKMIGQYEKTLPHESVLANRLNEIALFLDINARYQEAEFLYRRALAIREKILGPEHPDTATSLGNLALLLYKKGEYQAAEPLYRRALAIREKMLDPNSKSSVTATTLNNLAVLLSEKGDYREAEHSYRRALAIREKILGPEHPDTATTINNLALLLDEKGDYPEAEPLYRRALAISEKVLGPEHHDTATTLNNLALLLSKKGDYRQAEPLYRRALEIREKILGPEHPDTAQTLNNLASLLDKKGDYRQAEPLYLRALAIREKILGPEHPKTAITLNNLALLLSKKGDYRQAEPLYRRALAINEKALGPDHPIIATILCNLAALLCDKGDYRGAESLYRQILAITEKGRGKELS